MPAPTKPKPKPSPAFVALRFRIQRAARADKRLSGGQYRILDYVLNETWPDPETGMPVARVTDEMLTDDVPGHAAQSTLYRTRTYIAELGWWSFVPGKGATATVYTFYETPAEPILSALKASAARRKVAALERRTDRKNGTETLQSQHKRKRGRPRKIQGEPLQNATHQNDENAGIYLSPPYQDKALPQTVQDMAKGARAPEPAPVTCFICGKASVGLNGAGKPVCRSHMAKSLRAKSGPIIPTPTASPFICTECGEPAVIPCRETGEAYCARHAPSWLRAGIDYRRLSEGE